jgi:DNA-binding NarL/FixJ family response regulator
MTSSKPGAAGNLTPREVLVLSLAGEGLSDAEIAARLGSSERTVRIHLAMILAKKGAKNRVDAIVEYGRAVKPGDPGALDLPQTSCSSTTAAACAGAREL